MIFIDLEKAYDRILERYSCKLQSKNMFINGIFKDMFDGEITSTRTIGG